ncbi:MAG: tetratricopeptide repeat protein [Deltaproteobacteria bacterium]|nr:tetratricopeptide repeat protein [Deltaproteobacteria bacterium]
MGGILTRRALLIASSIIILFVLNMAVYNGSLKNGFVYDDQTQIVSNRLITDYSNLPEIFTTGIGKVDKTRRAPYYRPLHFTAYTIEYSLFGLEPMGWHLVNVLIHFLNAVLVFFLIRLILRTAGLGEGPGASLPALAGAAIFSVHPAGSEVVAWTACMPELLFTLFSLSAFYLYGRGRESSSTAARFLLVALSVLIYFLSNFAKETAIVLPAFLFTFDWAAGRLKSFKSLLWYAPYAAVAIAYVLIRGLAIGEVPPMDKFYPYLSLGQYFLNLFPLAADYLLMLFLPFSYAPFRVWETAASISEPRVFVSAIAIFSIAALYFIFRRSLNRMAALAFVIMLFPILKALLVINLSPTPQADRYLYYSAFGLAVGVSVLIAAALRRFVPKAVAATAAVLSALVVFVFSAESMERARYWESDLSLWQKTAEAMPDNYFARHFFGVAQLRSGSIDEGTVEIERSAALNSARPHPDRIILLRSRKALGVVYSRTGRPQDAIREYTLALGVEPDDFDSNSDLGGLYLQAGNYGEAVRLYEKASFVATSRSQVKESLMGLGEAYFLMGERERAKEIFREALSLYPGDVDFTEKLERLE